VRARTHNKWACARTRPDKWLNITIGFALRLNMIMGMRCPTNGNKWQNKMKSRKGVRARAPNKWQTTQNHKWARTKEQQITHIWVCERR